MSDSFLRCKGSEKWANDQIFGAEFAVFVPFLFLFSQGCGIRGIFAGYSCGIHMYRLCIGYVSVMYRLCIETDSE